MAYKLLDAAQERWRRFNGHELVADVLAGATVQGRHPGHRRPDHDDRREGRRLISVRPRSTTFDNCSHARRGEDFGARLCAEAMGTEAVHRALVRFAQGELGKPDRPAQRRRLRELRRPHGQCGPRSPRDTRHRLRGRDLTARQVLRIPRRPARQRRRHSRQPHAPTLNAPPRGAHRPARAARCTRPFHAKGGHNHPGSNGGTGPLVLGTWSGVWRPAS